MRETPASKLKYFLFIACLLTPAIARAEMLTIQGRVTNSSGQPVIGSAVKFRVQLYNPGSTPHCVLYDETHTEDLSQTNGLFSIELGKVDATKIVRNAPTNLSLAESISNRKQIDIPGQYCSPPVSGTANYVPAADDNRRVVIQFYDPSFMTGYETIPEMDLNPNAFAIEARNLGGFPSGSILRVVDTAGNPAATSALSQAQVTDLTALIGGTSTKYLQQSSNTGVQIPGNRPSTPAAGSIWFEGGVLKYSDAGGSEHTLGTGTGTLTSVSAGDGITVVNGSTAPTVSLRNLTPDPTATNVGDGSNVPTLTVDAYGRVTAISTTPISGGTLPSSASDGMFLKRSSGSWAASSILIGDLISQSGGPLFGATMCSGTQKLSMDTPTGKFVCQDITGFTGNLSGEVTGAQGATVVSGASTAASVSTLVRRDASAGIAARDLTMNNTAGTGSVTLGAPAGTYSSYALRLPAADGASNQILSTNGSGQLQWISQGGTSAISVLAPLVNSGSQISLPASTNSVDGYLSATDHAAFAAKQPAGNYLTTLTGDVTSSGFSSGSVATTIANGAVTDAKVTSVGIDKLLSAVGKYFTYAPNGTACADGQILKWDNTNSRWSCASASDATVQAFARNAPSADFSTPSGVLTLGTVGVAKGGTGLSTVGTANQLLGANAAGTGLEYKTVTAGSGVTLSNSAGALTISAAGSGGTVTSVDLSVPSFLSKSGGPITSSGSITLGLNSQTAATVFAAPSGSAGAPSFRSLYSSDIQSSQGGNYFTSSASCLTGQALVYNQTTDTVACQTLSLSSSQVTSALGFTPVNKAGDSMSGALALPSNGLSVGTSQLVVSGGNVGIGSVSPGAALDVKGAIRLSGSTSGYAGFQPAAAAGSTVWTLPNTDGTPGQVLSTNGAGILSWASGASGTITGVTATAPVVSSGGSAPVISMAAATSSVPGYLTAADWATFNAKAPLASPAFTSIPTAPTAAVDTNTTQLATTAFVLGQAASATPLMDGTAAVGNSTRFARGDHVHPTDTSRAPAAGSSSITTLGSITSGIWNGTAITVPYGGTGLTSGVAGSIPYYATSTTMTALPAGTAGQVLTSNGSGAPTWAAAATGSVTGSGTIGYLTKFVSSTGIGNSLLYDNGTNIGIGTSSPTAFLDVENNANTTGSVTANFLQPSLPATGSTYLKFGANVAANYNAADIRFDYAASGSTSNTLNFGFAGVGPKLSIMGNGNVGIGTTSPGAELEVADTAGDNDVRINLRAASGASNIMQVGRSTTQGFIDTKGAPFQLYTLGTSTPNFNVLASGNVGINTSAPASALDVGSGKISGGTYSTSYRTFLDLSYNSGAASAAMLFPAGGVFQQQENGVLGVNDIFMQAFPASNSGYGYFETWNGAGTVVGTGNSTPIIFRPNRQEAMRITSAGSVGIGTNAPGAALDVKGAIRLSGSTSGYTGFQPAAAAGSTVWTLPSADGTSGQVLSTNGAGVLSWANSSAGSVTGVTATAPVVSSGGTAPVISMAAATSSASGYLTAADWATFNGKAPLNSPAFTSTPTAPNAAVDTNTTQLATTAFVLGQAASVTPLMDGTAAVGNSTRFARGDHVHPTDTSRAPAAGSSSITTLGTIATGVWNGSAITVPYGGTGLTSGVAGSIPYYSTSTTMTALAAGTAGQVLTSNGAGAPTWSAVPASLSGTGTVGYLPKYGTSSSLTSSAIYESGGNVGIGTTGSVAPLQILNGLSPVSGLGSPANYGLLISSSGGTGGSTGLAFGVGNSTTNVGAAILHRRTGLWDSGNLEFYAGGGSSGAVPNLSLTLNNNGNAQLGGSYGFANPLSVSPLYNAAGTATQSGTTVTGTGTSFNASMVGMVFTYVGGTTAGTITAVASSTSLTVSNSLTVGTAAAFTISYPGLNVTSAGNVGIGTTTTTSKLEVAGSFFTHGGDFQIQDGGALDSTGVRVFSNGGNLYLQSGYGGATYMRNKSGLTKLTVLDGGNVGIGSISPGQPLEVNGTAKATALMTDTGQAFKMKTGTGSVSVNLTGPTGGSLTSVNFGYTFTSAPVVTITGTAAGNYLDCIIPSAIGISTTGFTVYQNTPCNQNVSGTYTFNWIAVGI